MALCCDRRVFVQEARFACLVSGGVLVPLELHQEVVGVLDLRVGRKLGIDLARNRVRFHHLQQVVVALLLSTFLPAHPLCLGLVLFLL